MTGSVAVAQERAFAEVRRISSVGLDGAELLRRAARALRRAAPHDAYCASTVDPASNLITHGVTEGMGEGAATRARPSSTTSTSRRTCTRPARWSAKAGRYSSSPGPPGEGSTAACATARFSNPLDSPTSSAASSLTAAPGAGWT
jgi:hypothetical protein